MIWIWHCCHLKNLILKTHLRRQIRPWFMIMCRLMISDATQLSAKKLLRFPSLSKKNIFHNFLINHRSVSVTQTTALFVTRTRLRCEEAQLIPPTSSISVNIGFVESVWWITSNAILWRIKSNKCSVQAKAAPTARSQSKKSELLFKTTRNF